MEHQQASEVEDSPLLACILDALDAFKGQDIRVLDLRGKNTLTDTMVVVSGNSDRHVFALSGSVIDALKDGGFAPPRVEGRTHCDWVLIDVGDVMVHIFRPEVRLFYAIERLWSSDLPQDETV